MHKPFFSSQNHWSRPGHSYPKPNSPTARSSPTSQPSFSTSEHWSVLSFFSCFGSNSLGLPPFECDWRTRTRHWVGTGHVEGNPKQLITCQLCPFADRPALSAPNSPTLPRLQPPFLPCTPCPTSHGSPSAISLPAASLHSHMWVSVCLQTTVP